VAAVRRRGGGKDHRRHGELLRHGGGGGGGYDGWRRRGFRDLRGCGRSGSWVFRLREKGIGRESRRPTARWEMDSTVLSFGLRFLFFNFLLRVSWLRKGANAIVHDDGPSASFQLQVQNIQTNMFKISLVKCNYEVAIHTSIVIYQCFYWEKVERDFWKEKKNFFELLTDFVLES
jgi:hypothetical protein